VRSSDAYEEFWSDAGERPAVVVDALYNSEHAENAADAEAEESVPGLQI
jgi:hypothetical protein